MYVVEPTDAQDETEPVAAAPDDVAVPDPVPVAETVMNETVKLKPVAATAEDVAAEDDDKAPPDLTPEMMLLPLEMKMPDGFLR